MHTFIYQKQRLFDRPVQLDQCRASVANGGRSVGVHQCTKLGKKPWTDPKDGEVYLFCTNHHPDDVAVREKARAVAWHQEVVTRHQRSLRGFTDDQLRAELARRAAVAAKVPDSLKMLTEVSDG